ncbi:hypothetical protein [Ekhidna sp. To15]|uniref:hypothetical protein n=1 Tax=Ekhidna sp. To15 TaxID=3395267 RepID=UPI003F51DF70
MKDLTQRVHWITHKNKRILLADYSQLKGADLMAVFRESKQTQINAGKDVLLIVNFTGAKANNEIVNALKQAGKELDNDMKRTAVIGLTALHKIFYNGYIRVTGQGNRTRVFDQLEQSFDWIVSD